MDCERPLRAVCLDCDEVRFWRCDTYGCGPCAEVKKKRLCHLVDQGSAIHLANGMLGYFLTLTLPGNAEHLRWYQGVRPTHREACHCHDDGATDGLRNRYESQRWNRLRTSLTRDRQVTFAGAVETQKRGLLHRHILLFTDRVLTHQEAQDLALRAGYGCVLDLEPVKSAQKAARYLAKYVTKSSGERPDVAWETLDPATGEVIATGATYRLWSSSRDWGVTMREMKATRSAQAAARARYLLELSQLLATDAGGLAPETAGHVHMTGPPP